MTPDLDVQTFDAWRAKAEEDFESPRILTDHKGPAATICFLCQQVAEKYLKGYLLLHRQPLQRIHQLDRLLEECIAVDASFRVLIEDAVFLKGYYIGSRSPDGLPEDVTPEESASAMEAASRLREFVLARLP